MAQSGGWTLGRRVNQVGDRVWLVTLMDYDLGYFDDETCRLELTEHREFEIGNRPHFVPPMPPGPEG